MDRLFRQSEFFKNQEAGCAARAVIRRSESVLHFLFYFGETYLVTVLAMEYSRISIIDRNQIQSASLLLKMYASYCNVST